MPRIKASPKKCVKTSNSSAANSWVFLMKGDGLDGADGGGKPDVVKLKHPASGQSAMFVFSPGDLTVQEVLTFDENKRSWFIDDYVKSDGKMHLSTPIDPIFLVLPYLRNSQHVMPLEQVLRDEDYPETSRLAKCQNLKLSLVADRKGDESYQAFKYNEDKTMLWLQKKVERVADILRQKGIHVSQGAVSANYVKSSKYEAGTDLEYLKYAHGIVSEYLTDDLSKKLGLYLNFTDETEKKRKMVVNPKDGPEEKRQKKETVDESLTRSLALDLTKPEKPQKPPPLTKKEIARQKAAAGSKSITSFFKKK